MKNNFDLKKFLVENKLTTNSKTLNEAKTELSDFGQKELFPYLKQAGVTYKALNGYISDEDRKHLSENGDKKLAVVTYKGDDRELVGVHVHKNNKDILEDIINKFDFTEKGFTQKIEDGRFDLSILVLINE